MQSIVRVGTGGHANPMDLVNHREARNTHQRAEGERSIRRLRDGETGSGSGFRLIIQRVVQSLPGNTAEHRRRFPGCQIRAHQAQAVLDEFLALVAGLHLPARRAVIRARCLGFKTPVGRFAQAGDPEQRQQVITFHQRVQMSLSGLLVRSPVVRILLRVDSSNTRGERGENSSFLTRTVGLVDVHPAVFSGQRRNVGVHALGNLFF